MARSSNPLVKVVVAVVLLAGLGFLFVRSVQNTRAQPYAIERTHLDNWTLVAAPAPALAPSSAMIALKPPADLPNTLFRQLFERTAESMSAPSAASIALILQGEFDRAFAGRVSRDALLSSARQAFDGAALEPRCIGSRRESAPGVTRQVHFVLFDAPAFARFRTQIAAQLPAGNASLFDPAALSPVLFVGGSDPEFDRWLPVRASPDRDCVAPITVQ